MYGLNHNITYIFIVLIILTIYPIGIGVCSLLEWIVNNLSY
jgi:hypothetical protein